MRLSIPIIVCLSLFLVAMAPVRLSIDAMTIDTNAKVKALFIYNFSKYIEWPSTMDGATFQIAVLGEYPTLMSELNNMATTKKAGNRPFEIRNYNDVNQLGSCHILFVESKYSSEIANIVNRLQGRNTLLVTEGEGLAQSASAINFFYADNKQRMEINQANIVKYNLKVSSKLLAIAKVVN